ncbi:prevent-host-death family protein [Bradyrhizobium sp. AZCC 2262]|uniref:type II toxin-antitoxin system Phd/YefM family antitoxin n=1 Tax=Bradyrhizobium sp. AZCC 2262 TaxID=3117022 RepID=UPI002FF0CB46
MKIMSAKDAKNGFGRLIDTALAEPVTIEKHGRGVVVVMSIEEYERLKAPDPPAAAPVHKAEKRI